MTERQRNRWKGDPHFRPDKPVLNKVATPEEATHAMNDRNFTKFVFFRDPAERLLSAYLDKFEHGSRYRVGYGLRIFKDPKMNFSGFVERIERVNKRRSNPDGLHPAHEPALAAAKVYVQSGEVPASLHFRWVLYSFEGAY